MLATAGLGGHSVSSRLSSGGNIFIVDLFLTGIGTVSGYTVQFNVFLFSRLEQSFQSIRCYLTKFSLIRRISKTKFNVWHYEIWWNVVRWQKIDSVYQYGFAAWNRI